MYNPQSGLKLWQLQSYHKEKVAQLCNELKKAFTTHPSLTGETYWQHLWFTIKMSVRFLGAGMVMITHGLLPFLFGHVASRQAATLYKIMRRRIPRIRRVKIDPIFEV